MNDEKFPSHRLDKVALRLPDGMREALARAAEHAGRSMNAEIVARLAQSLAEADNNDALLREVRRQLVLAEKLGERLAQVDPEFAKSRSQFDTLAKEVYADKSERPEARKRPRLRPK